MGKCLRNQSDLTLAVWHTKTAFHLQLDRPSPGELGSVLKSAPRVAFAEIVWFQQLGYAFIIVVYPVLRLLHAILLRTNCSGPCTSLSVIWHSLPSETLWSRREIVASEWNWQARREDGRWSNIFIRRKLTGFSHTGTMTDPICSLRMWLYWQCQQKSWVFGDMGTEWCSQPRRVALWGKSGARWWRRCSAPRLGWQIKALREP